MISAHVVRMPDNTFKVRLTEVQGDKIVFQKIIDPNDAAFLSLEIDEILRDIRHLTPRSHG